MKWCCVFLYLCQCSQTLHLSEDECGVVAELVDLAQGCISLRQEAWRWLQGVKPFSQAAPPLWTRLILRLGKERLCENSVVAGTVFGRLAEMIFGELVEQGWLDLSKESFTDSRLREWQVNYLSLLGIVERMSMFSLQINGLNQDPVRNICHRAHFERCRSEFKVSSTKVAGFMGCLATEDTLWKPDERSWTLSDRKQGANQEVDRVLKEVDTLFKAQHVVIHYPSSLVPSMRMMGVLEPFFDVYGITCDHDRKMSLFPFGAGMANADVEIFESLRHLPSFRVRRIFGIGNAFGYSTMILAKLWPSAALDVLESESEGCAHVGSEVTRRIARSLGADVNLHIGFSPQDVPAAVRKPRRYELAFLDGNHTMEQLLLDFEAVRPFLAQRSVVVLHDVEFAFLESAVQWILASDAGVSFRYFRGKTQAYRNVLGTGMLVRNISEEEMLAVGTPVDWS